MLAIASTTELTLVESSKLKTTPISLPTTFALITPPVACSWSQDNTSLLITSGPSIYRYKPSGQLDTTIFTTSGPISCLCVKERNNTIICTVDSNILILESADTTPKLAKSLESHTSVVNSLSLSNDSSLLASTSATAVYVHNLTLGSHTVLRGQPPSPITTCTFHPHTRTRLLVGVGQQLLVYDTTRPSRPAKTINLDNVSGNINVITCSPFSKTLIAVTTTGGNVGLIDLDKEKGLFHTLNVKTPITAASFSHQGAALYFGTKHGKLLITDLRALDKPPTAATVGSEGSRIQCLAVQKKLKAGTELSKSPDTVSSTSKTTDPHRKPALKVKSSKASSRQHEVATKVEVPIQEERSSQNSGPTQPLHRARRTAPISPKIAFSPIRDPLGNMQSAEVDATILPDVGKLAIKANVRPPSRARSEQSDSASAARISRASSHSSSRAKQSLSDLALPLSRATTASSASAFSKAGTSHIPSPELPTALPITPVAKTRSKGVLGLDTPEVEAWISAEQDSEKEGRRVGFAEGRDIEDKASTFVPADELERERELSMQISPRRPPPTSASWVPIPSPLRPGAGANHVQDMLRGLVRDALYDAQRDTKAGLVGLHLDLLKMGRGMRTEMHDAVKGYIIEIRALREENQRLRDENERLRRGY